MCDVIFTFAENKCGRYDWRWQIWINTLKNIIMYVVLTWQHYFALTLFVFGNAKPWNKKIIIQILSIDWFKNNNNYKSNQTIIFYGIIGEYSSSKTKTKNFWRYQIPTLRVHSSVNFFAFSNGRHTHFLRNGPPAFSYEDPYPRVNSLWNSTSLHTLKDPQHLPVDDLRSQFRSFEPLYCSCRRT